MNNVTRWKLCKSRLENKSDVPVDIEREDSFLDDVKIKAHFVCQLPAFRSNLMFQFLQETPSFDEKLTVNTVLKQKFHFVNKKYKKINSIKNNRENNFLCI